MKSVRGCVVWMQSHGLFVGLAASMVFGFLACLALVRLGSLREALVMALMTTLALLVIILSFLHSPVLLLAHVWPPYMCLRFIPGHIWKKIAAYHRYNAVQQTQGMVRHSYSHPANASVTEARYADVVREARRRKHAQ